MDHRMCEGTLLELVYFVVQGNEEDESWWTTYYLRASDFGRCFTPSNYRATPGPLTYQQYISAELLYQNVIV